eukprot:1150520-Pelagomonas_calceolata.AAC.1
MTTGSNTTGGDGTAGHGMFNRCSGCVNFSAYNSGNSNQAKNAKVPVSKLGCHAEMNDLYTSQMCTSTRGVYEPGCSLQTPISFRLRVLECSSTRPISPTLWLTVLSINPFPPDPHQL